MWIFLLKEDNSLTVGVNNSETLLTLQCTWTFVVIKLFEHLKNLKDEFLDPL